MRKGIFTLAATVCIVGTMICSCQSQADKVRNAEDKLQDANEKQEAAVRNLDQALRDSIQHFRKESEESLNANERSIEEYRVKIAAEKSGTRARDERRLASLEQQNSDMRKNLEAFNDTQRDKWDSFRLRFKHDMEDHARAMRDFWTGGR